MQIFSFFSNHKIGAIGGTRTHQPCAPQAPALPIELLPRDEGDVDSIPYHKVGPS